ncbi:MAG: Rz-like lysis system protein LysB [Ewingella sp.]
MRVLMGIMPALLIAAFAAVGVQRYQLTSLKADIAANERVIGTLSAGIESRDRAITRMKSEADELEQQGRSLRDALTGAGQQAREREYDIQRLLNENKVLRDWFATPLPDDVIRLQQRPAFATPGDYLRWLSRRQQLPDPGQSAQN